VYNDLNEYRQALHYLYQAKKINESLSNKYVGSRWLSGIGSVYEKLNILDSALFFQKKAQAFSNLFKENFSGTLILTRLAVIQSKLNHFDIALRYLQEAIKSSYVTNDIVNRCRAQYQIDSSNC
jgi:tetratricopeptide (TPR) repeat protein